MLKSKLKNLEKMVEVKDMSVSSIDEEKMVNWMYLKLYCSMHTGREENSSVKPCSEKALWEDLCPLEKYKSPGSSKDLLLSSSNRNTVSSNTNNVNLNTPNCGQGENANVFSPPKTHAHIQANSFNIHPSNLNSNNLNPFIPKHSLPKTTLPVLPNQINPPVIKFSQLRNGAAPHPPAVPFVKKKSNSNVYFNSNSYPVSEQKSSNTNNGNNDLNTSANYGKTKASPIPQNASNQNKSDFVYDEIDKLDKLSLINAGARYELLHAKNLLLDFDLSLRVISLLFKVSYWF